jgi:hypothetical protein
MTSPQRFRSKHRVVSGSDDFLVDGLKDDGSFELENFLSQQNFQRISVSDVCKEPTVDPMQLAVFLHSNGLWGQLSPAEVLKIWKTAQLTQKSFCRILKTNLFNLQARHKTSFMRALNHHTSADSVGFYKGKDSQFALVVRLPSDFNLQKNLALLGSFAAGLGARTEFKSRATGVKRFDALRSQFVE